MEMPPLIEAKAGVMMGKPCFQGTRIPVYLILEKLAAGESQQQILTAYPQLREEHVRAATGLSQPQRKRIFSGPAGPL